MHQLSAPAGSNEARPRQWPNSRQCQLGQAGHGNVFTDPFTTIPVITEPVIVFKSAKNLCSSFSLALAT
jgi:hypothetical protein